MSEFDSSLAIVENGAPKTKRKHTKIVNLMIKLAVFVLINAHFIWASYYFINNTSDTLDSTTCSGYGLWIIVFIFIYFLTLYSLLLKPYILPLIDTKKLAPLFKPINRIPHWPLVSRGVVLAAILAFIVYDYRDDFTRLMPLTGLVIFFIIGFLFSPAKKQIPWPTVISGLIAQFVLGLLMIRWETGRNIFSCVGDRVDTFLHYAVNASAFVYSEELVLTKAIFAFNALAAIYLMNFCINILYYYGIMQSIVLELGKILQFVLGTPICESVNSAANIFLGMSESPFLLKPYLDHLTDSEIHSIMTSGFASVSGTVLAAYISFGASPAHLVTSCVMSAPAALCYSKLMYPETEEVTVTQENIKTMKMKFGSVLDAATKGANEASQVVIGIIANLISFISFVYFINGVLGWLGTLVGFIAEDEIWSLELILGKILIPLSYTMGVEWADCEKVAQLIGMKTILNEFIAFQKMKTMDLSDKSRIIATYSICGFANPGSIGTMLSTLTIFMPRKKHSVTKLVFRAFIGGSFACFMTACIAGLLTV
ncbi:Sodium/nucleoside cotransporter 2-like Protein [Tribolium castaneum]|uniref:Sodium/nucleoside cotransporter 2-like Protein n=1 Tax=Tribolium castaneum TaxID=7070 RepID=D2A4P8_TRICA|nr:PREDICTED: solute carrier family 28 member 3 [Tribolium castaneum]EFA05195.1 Sodium/nucleoside cotransporter 2-like Protein [Tribolium castaneum]|eukprot:XP_971690.1 PREDICTED: solute carrier family 28 member 3 [Tribolium castaneum]